MPFLNKCFNSLYSVIKFIIVLKNDLSIIKPIFYQWSKKITQDFNVQICIDCWGNDCYLPWSFKWYTTLYHEWHGKFFSAVSEYKNSLETTEYASSFVSVRNYCFVERYNERKKFPMVAAGSAVQINWCNSRYLFRT